MSSRDENETGDITRLLQQVSGGDRRAFDALVELVYAELNDLARRRLRGEATGHTLSTTGLVHETYLRLAGQTRADWQSREQFFAVASEAMRRVLVDHARRRQRTKRGGHTAHVPLEDADVADPAWLTEDDADTVVALDEALQSLAAFNPEGARIVQMRFFGGLSNEEVAQVLQSSERSVRRSWAVAKAWLRRDMSERIGEGATLAAFTHPDEE